MSDQSNLAMLRNVKFRESTGNSKYGDWFEVVWYGIFHGWGVLSGQSAVIIEITHSQTTVNASREFDALEMPEKNESMKGTIRLVSLSQVSLRFID